MTDPNDLLDEEKVGFLAAKWSIPRREARRMLRRLAENNSLGVEDSR
jgi:hypothetical protein